MNLLIVVLFVLLSAINLYSGVRGIPDYLTTDILEDEEHFHCCSHYPMKTVKFNVEDKESAIIRKPYDVLNYDLFLDWYNPLSTERNFYIDTVLIRVDTIYNPEGGIVRIDSIKGTNTIYYLDTKWSGVNRITLHIDSSGITKLPIDARQLRIDSIFYNGSKIEWEARVVSDGFNVPSDGVIIGDTIWLDIYYTYLDNGRGGFWLYPEGHFVGFSQRGDTVIVEERLAYTMSEPIDARRWMPCNDAPYDKAISKITIRVPKGFNTASNGLLTRTVNSGDATTYYWEHEYPITTYLMLAVASKFKEFSDIYEKMDNPEDKIEIQYYVWEKDYNNTATDGTEYNAQHSFRNMVDMMKAYTKIFGEYPFEKYGMAVLQPFSFGGMEHQTMTTINRVWLRGWYESGIAHELVHQWLGDLITCATWNDIWINEGGATWGEGLWMESQFDRGSYYYYMNQHKKRYLSSLHLYDTPIYGVPIQFIFWTHVPLVYQKAGLVYLMLRETLGDDVFFNNLRGLMDEYRFQSLETRDFERYFAENTVAPPVPMDVFFDQWIYKAGHPIFEIQTTASSFGGMYKITADISQIQSGTYIPDVFHVLAELQFFSGDESVIHTIVINERNQQFEFEVPFLPDSVTINGDKLLCQIAGSFVSVTESIKGEDFVDGIIYPNPVLSSSDGSFGFNIDTPSEIIVELYDVYSLKIMNLYNGYLNAGSYDLNIPSSRLSSGVYMIKVIIGGRVSSYHFVVL